MADKPTYEELEQRVNEFEKESLERSQVEEVLLKSEEKFRTIFLSAPVGIAIARPEGRFIEVNDAVCRMLDYSKEELREMTFLDITYPNDRSETQKLADKVWDGKSDFYQAEKRYLKKDGSPVWATITASAIRDRSGEVEYWIGIMEDISEEKKAKEALIASHETLLTVLDSMDATVYVADMENYEILFMNKYMKDTFGGNLEGKKCWKVFRGESKPCDHCTNNQLVDENGKPTGVFIWEDENTLNRKWYINFDQAIKWIDGQLVRLQIAVDITKIKQLEREQLEKEQQLLQSQKMEAIGTLAGGIAHDFNNLLMGIQGRTSLMLHEIDSMHPHFEHLKGVEDYIKSATDLTKQLLGFARGGKYEVKPTDLNELITSSAVLFGRTKKEISIHRKMQVDLWTVEVDQRQIEQVALNLYVNAWHSMPGGGKLFLETKNVMLDDDFVKTFELGPGKYVEISVTDTGVGMDQTTQKRIFDPFFTTKEMGRGTGLGLASAYGIIKNHSGIINVFSEKGKGASFNIYLPASEKEVVKDKKLAKEILKGYGTILLVDDEDMIIDVGKELLKKMGYKVLVTKSGKAAVELYEANKDEIDLVILDMIMPNMGGGDTYDKLKEVDSDIKVLLSSGYSVDGQATEILERGCNGFIQKPFNMIDLSQKIRKILDKKQFLTIL